MNIEDIKQIPEIGNNNKRLVKFLILLKTHDKELIDEFLKNCRKSDAVLKYHNKKKNDENYKTKRNEREKLRYLENNDVLLYKLA
jgi:ubiquinone biosynthesis protein COQ9